MATTSERLAGSEQAQGLVKEAPRSEALERTLSDSLRRMMDSVRPDGIFGSVVEREGVAVIPCTEITASFGIGGGSGVGPAPARQGQTSAAGAETVMPGGGGVGGGGGARGRPVPVVVMSHGKTRVLPVVDVTRFMLAAMATTGIIAFLLSQMIVGRSGARGRRMGGAMSAVRLARALRAPLGRNV